ncbi:hypothetical protein FBQ97_18325, partial [Acidobacteria bacterium ACD]|nr:hypothetical protein [Acidobacteria bacterium ACD]
PYHDWYFWKNWPDEYVAYYNVADLPKLNVDNPAVRDHLLHSIGYWLGDVGFDGLRLDHANGPSYDFWTDVRVVARSIRPDAWVFGEVVRSPDQQLSYAGLFDGTLDFMLAQAMRNTFATGEMSLAGFDALLNRHEAYFRENPGAYLQPEKRKAKYLLVETAKVRQTVTVTDAEVANEYNSNLDAYKKKEEVKARHVLYKTDGTPASEAAARAKAEAAKKKLDAGADFAALAKAESEDTGSKASGGDLGFFERGRMVKEFEDAAFSAEPNAIVGPVKSAFGFHVIQVLEKRSERIQPLFDVAAAIKARLQDERAADETKRMARDVADRLAREGGKPSDDQLRAMTGPLVTFNETEFVGKSDAPAGIGFNPAFSQALFSLSLNEVSDPVSTARGEAIVKLVDVKKPGMPAFADVKARVTGDLVKKKQDDATLSALRAAMTPGATLESVAAAVGAKVETADSFGKNGPVGTLGSPKALLDAAFAAEPGAVKGPLLVPDRGAVAFQLLEKTAFDQAAFEAQREEIRDRLKNQKSGRLLQAMVARKRAETKITVNKELLARFGGRD